MAGRQARQTPFLWGVVTRRDHGPCSRRSRGKAARAAGAPPKVGQRRTSGTPQRTPNRAKAAHGPFSAASSGRANEPFARSRAPAGALETPDTGCAALRG
jgi:hypothetical protein